MPLFQSSSLLWPGKAVEDGPSAWALHPMGDQEKHLASAIGSAQHASCGCHWRVNQRQKEDLSLCLSLSLSTLPVKNKKKDLEKQGWLCGWGTCRHTSTKNISQCNQTSGHHSCTCSSILGHFHRSIQDRSFCKSFLVMPDVLGCFRGVCSEESSSGYRRAGALPA